MLAGIRNYGDSQPCDCGNRNPKTAGECQDCGRDGCESCYEIVDDKYLCGKCSDARHVAAEDLAEEELPEPECSCVYVDVDRVDNSSCEVHHG